MVTGITEVQRYLADIDSALSRGIKQQIEDLEGGMQTLNFSLELIQTTAQGASSLCQSIDSWYRMLLRPCPILFSSLHMYS